MEPEWAKILLDAVSSCREASRAKKKKRSEAMSVQPAATSRPPLPGAGRRISSADLRRNARWVLLARVGWSITFVISLAVFVANLLVSRLDPLSVMALVTTTSIWYIVSGVLLWSKPKDRVVVLFSLSFMLVGGVLLPGQTLVYVPGLSWGVGLALALVQAVAQSSLLFFYLFPDGRFVPSWTRFLAIAWIIVSIASNVPSFVHISAFNPLDPTYPSVVYGTIDAAFFCSCVFSLLYRYLRISTPVQRQQTRWVVFASLIPLLAYSALDLELGVLPSYLPVFALPHQLVPLIARVVNWVLPVIGPIAIGIALMRYRLWTIDLIINLTLVYGLLSGILTVLYIGSIVLLQGVLGRFTNGSALAVVGSTLAIAALFTPLRSRIQTIIDRRFYRRSYDAARTIEAFGETLRKEVDLNTLSEQLVAVVHDIMKPTQVSLWLQQQDSPVQKPFREPVTAERSAAPHAIVAKTGIATPAHVPDPSSRRISRRAALIGLAAGGVVIASGDLSWWLLVRHPSVTYRGHSQQVFAVAWSPDGRRIASGGGDQTVQVWNAADGSHVFTYRGHVGNVDAVAWSPDGRRIASGGADGTVQIWRIVEESRAFTYRGHIHSVLAVAWSPDGSRIASGGSDQTVQIWVPA
jgi:hypothetical protein